MKDFTKKNKALNLSIVILPCIYCLLLLILAIIDTGGCVEGVFVICNQANFSLLLILEWPLVLVSFISYLLKTNTPSKIAAIIYIILNIIAANLSENDLFILIIILGIIVCVVMLILINTVKSRRPKRKSK